MPQSQKLAQYLLQAFDRHECTIDEIFTTALNQFSEKLKNYLEAITYAEPIFESHAIDITEKIDEFNKLVYDVDQFAQDLKPALWLTYLSQSAKDKYQNCHDLHMLYTEVQPLLHFMLVIAQRMKDKIITPTLSERLCSLLQQQLAINIKATALENQQNHSATNLHFSSKSQTNKLTYITKNPPSLANHLVVAWKESRHNPYVLMNTLLNFFHEKNGGKIIETKQNIPQAAQEKPANTSQFKL